MRQGRTIQKNQIRTHSFLELYHRERVSCFWQALVVSDLKVSLRVLNVAAPLASWQITYDAAADPSRIRSSAIQTTTQSQPCQLPAPI